MTVANDILGIALRNGGIVGVGQVPLPDDTNDSFRVMNAWINELNLERHNKVNLITLPTFPSLTSNVPFWTPYEHVLLTSMAVRLRQIYALPAVDLDVKLAALALEAFNSINQQQIAPLYTGVPQTVQQAIFLALRLAGRITDEQSVSATSKDVYDAFALLVMMMAQWQRKRWLLWNEQEVSLVSTGANFYTIGPGQDFDTARPDKIHAAWVRIGSATSSFGTGTSYELATMLPFPLGTEGSGTGTGQTQNLVDLPLAIIEAKEDWATIAIKDLKSIPAAVFYDSSWPVGRIYFWPVPIASQYELHLVVKASLPVYGSLSDQLNLPPEYLDAVINNLAVRIAVASGGQISPALLGQAKGSLETIRMANSQIPLLSMPTALSGHRGSDGSSWVGRGLDRAWTVGGSSVLG